MGTKLATYSVIGRGDTQVNIGNIDVKVALPELKDLLEKLPQEVTVNVEAPTVNVTPEIKVEPAIITVTVPDVNVPLPVINVYPRNIIRIDLKEIICKFQVPDAVKTLLIIGITGLYILIAVLVSIVGLYLYYHT